MKILHIISQKPYSTGSGVYMTELVNALAKSNNKNACIYGINKNDNIFFDEKYIKNFPIFFNTKELPFNIFGMSDEMPYKSSQYSDMNDDIFSKYKNAFYNQIKNALNIFEPDIIFCHHLYLTTAITREICKDIKIIGFCHNTDLRQLKKTKFMNEYITTNIKNLDLIISPTAFLKNEIINTYKVDDNKIKILSSGYNNEIFYNKHLNKDLSKIKFIYVGKMSKVKGVIDLLKAFKLVENEIGCDKIKLTLAGSSGNATEYNEILEIFNSLKIEKELYGIVDKSTLSNLYNQNDVFILTSYTEAVPLTSIEALSCGLKIIVSNIESIKEFLTQNVENAYIDYVELPKLTNVDEVSDEEMKKYEIRIKNSIIKVINNNKTYNPKISNVSFKVLAEKLIFLISK